MARPKKIGLEYFPLDCQMDDKIEMLEAEHDLIGFAVYIKLLQQIYQTENGELDMSIVFRWKTLGKTLGIPAENLRKMVETMLEIGLFHRKTFEERNVLTSSGVKKRIEKVDELRTKDRRRKEIAISEGETAETETIPPENESIPPEKPRKSTQKEKEKEIDTNVSIKGKENGKETSLEEEGEVAAGAAPPIESEEDLKKKKEKAAQTEAANFKAFTDAYYLFYEKKVGVPPNFTPADGVAAAKLHKYLAKASTDKSDQGALNSLNFIFHHWDKLEPYLQDQLDLKQINSNINNIMNQVKNGAAKLSNRNGKPAINLSKLGAMVDYGTSKGNR